MFKSLESHFGSKSRVIDLCVPRKVPRWAGSQEAAAGAIRGCLLPASCVEYAGPGARYDLSLLTPSIRGRDKDYSVEKVKLEFTDWSQCREVVRLGFEPRPAGPRAIYSVHIQSHQRTSSTEAPQSNRRLEAKE